MPIRTVYVTGISETVANIGRLRRGIREENRSVVDDQSARLFKITTGIVPYFSGRVYNSAFNTDLTFDPNLPTRAVGYDSSIPYIWDLHETPNRVHPARGPRQEPKQDHFLSEPRTAMEAVFLGVLRARLHARISRMHSLTSVQKAQAVASVEEAL